MAVSPDVVGFLSGRAWNSLGPDPSNSNCHEFEKSQWKIAVICPHMVSAKDMELIFISEGLKATTRSGFVEGYRGTLRGCPVVVAAIGDSQLCNLKEVMPQLRP